MQKEIYTLKIPNKEIHLPLYSLEEASSSLDIAHKLFQENNFPEWSSVLIGVQTQGRGQMRHLWHSPKGNLYAAIHLPNAGIFKSQASAPILGGILAESLNNLFEEERKKQDISFCLKWTNDLLIKDQNNYYKLGGILLEEKNGMLVAGIGINIQSSPDFKVFEKDKNLPATHLSHYFSIENDTINSLWSRLVYSIYLCYYLGALEVEQSSACLSCIQEKDIYEQEYILQKQSLMRTNNYLAFKNAKVEIYDALPYDSFDYDEDNQQITKYYGVLEEISLEEKSIGGITIETEHGKRTFLNGRIRHLLP